MDYPFKGEQASPFADPSVTAQISDDNVPSAIGGETTGTGGATWGAGPTSWDTVGTAGTWSSAPQPAPRETDSGHVQRMNDNLGRENFNQQPDPFASIPEQATVPVDRTKNWPSFYPLWYHNIEAEVPESMKNTVKLGYTTYLGFLVVIVYNFIGVSMGFLEDFNVDKLLPWLAAVLYLLAGPYVAWAMWYGRLYNAAVHDRSFTYIWFFLMYTLHVIFCIIAFLGIPGAGGYSVTGLVIGFKKFSDTRWLGLFYLVGAGLWGLEAFACIFVWQQAMRVFRGQGGPKAFKQEAQQRVGEAAISSVYQRL